MIVMNRDGDLFDERRKKERRKKTPVRMLPGSSLDAFISVQVVKKLSVV